MVLMVWWYCRDSPCICGRKLGDDKWDAVALTVNHKPDMPYELARIAKHGEATLCLVAGAYVPCGW